MSHRPVRGSTLTAREAEVLDLLAGDLSRAEVAAHLDLAPSTVADLVTSARSRLGVRTTAAAVGVRTASLVAAAAARGTL